MYFCFITVRQPPACPVLPRPKNCVSGVSSQCSKDSDCPVFTKCCWDGCIQRCVDTSSKVHKMSKSVLLNFLFCCGLPVVNGRWGRLENIYIWSWRREGRETSYRVTCTDNRFHYFNIITVSKILIVLLSGSKFGSCPNHDTNNKCTAMHDLCLDDSYCLGDEKCCMDTDCGRKCMLPNMLQMIKNCK